MWRKAGPSILVVLSILVELLWVSTPFYRYGLRGRPAVLYGRFTLLETFLFPHWIGYVWMVALVLQIAAVFFLLFPLKSSRGTTGVAASLASGLILLWISIALIFLWRTLDLWPMYLLGVLSSIVLAASAVVRLCWKCA